MVSDIRDDTEKEYCDYLVIYGDRIEIYFIEFSTEGDLKKYLFDYLSTKSKYISENYSKYNLHQLIEIVLKIGKEMFNKTGDNKNRIYRIIKGKTLYTHF